MNVSDRWDRDPQDLNTWNIANLQLHHQNTCFDRSLQGLPGVAVSSVLSASTGLPSFSVRRHLCARFSCSKNRELLAPQLFEYERFRCLSFART